MNWKLAIFDFDGTLADSGDWFLSNLNPVADRFGFRRVADEEVEALRGLPNREVIRHLGITWWKLPRIARHMRALAARDAASIKLFDGVEAMLQRLSAGGLALAIVSSNAEANVRRILGPGSAALIGHYECGAALFGKHRRLKRAARKMGFRPDQAIVIGDESRDIEAAKTVGMASAAVGWGYARPELLARFAPTLTCTEVRDIVAALAP